MRPKGAALLHYKIVQFAQMDFGLVVGEGGGTYKSQVRTFHRVVSHFKRFHNWKMSAPHKLAVMFI